MRYKRMTVLPAVLVFVLLACANQPTEFENGGFAYRENVSRQVEATVFPDTSAVMHRDINAGEKKYLILGQFNQQKCRVLLKFSELPEDVQVHSAALQMIPKHVYGSPQSDFTGMLHVVESAWNETSIPDATFGGARSSFTVHASVRDTDIVEIPVDVMQDWVDSTVINNGMLLSFDNAGFAKQYYSRTNAESVQLQLKYYENDTTIAEQLLKPSEDSYVVEGTAPLDAGYYVTNYGADRLIMRFDLDSIPETAAVNYAELVLTLDPAQSILGPEDEYRFRINLVETASWEAADFSASEDAAASGALDAGNEVHFVVTGMVQDWTSKKADGSGSLLHPNYGMILASYSEKTDLSQFVFFGGDENFSSRANRKAPGALRPRLYIVYTDFVPD